MKKVHIFASFLIFISLQLAGQNPQDTIYLKNGSVVYGKILENSENLFRIETNDGYFFSFSPLEVERYIARVPAVKDLKKTRGFNFVMENGFLPGSGDKAFFLLFSITPMINYTFNPIHSLSVGTGLESYEEFMIPLVLEYKINFSDRNATPFFYAKAGGLFNLHADEGDENYNTDYKPGWTCGTGLGYSWPIANFESFVQIGYRYTHTCTVINDNYQPQHQQFTYKTNLNRFEITWGFKF
jgi:hypothetical protein